MFGNGTKKNFHEQQIEIGTLFNDIIDRLNWLEKKEESKNNNKRNINIFQEIDLISRYSLRFSIKMHLIFADVIQRAW